MLHHSTSCSHGRLSHIDQSSGVEKCCTIVNVSCITEKIIENCKRKWISSSILFDLHFCPSTLSNLRVIYLWIRTPWCIALKNWWLNVIKRPKTLFFNFHLYSHPCFADWLAVARIYTGVALSLLWAPSIRLFVNNLYGSVLIFTLPFQNLLWLFAAIWMLSRQSAECSGEYFKPHLITHAFKQLDRMRTDNNTAFKNAFNNWYLALQYIHVYFVKFHDGLIYKVLEN